jgi:hypothetical protein
MRKICFLLFLFAAALGAAAQKTVYDPNAQLRTVRDFHSVQVSGGIDLFLSPGDEAVAVSASEEKYRDRIRTEVENGVLKIYFDWKEGRNFMMGGNKKLRAYVSFRQLRSLSASGGCDVQVEGKIQSEEFSLNVSGGSDFEGALDVRRLKVHQSGGADIQASGRAANITIDASGGSDFSGFGLETETCEIEASGGSDVEISVSKELSARASGASDIRYKGTPTVNMNSSGASSISRRS